MRRFLLLVLLLAAIAIGVGIYLGWWSVAIHHDKIHSDLSWGKQEAGHVANEAEKQGEKIRSGADSAAHSKTVQGRIADVNPGASTFNLETADQNKLTLHTEATTQIEEENQPTKLDPSKDGAQATVVYQVKDNKNYATRVTLAAK